MHKTTETYLSTVIVPGISPGGARVAMVRFILTAEATCKLTPMKTEEAQQADFWSAFFVGLT